MRRIPRTSTALLLTGLFVTAGCSGSSSTAASAAQVPATRLTYADPAGSGWRLVRHSSSTATRLVLELVGEGGQLTRGVGFNLPLPAGVKAGSFGGGLPLESTGVYELLSANDDPNEPVAMVGGVTPGRKLSVGLYQKDRARSAKDSGRSLLRIALELDPTQPPRAGARLALSVPKARAIPEDIGTTTEATALLDKKLQMVNLAIAVGTLTAE